MSSFETKAEMEGMGWFGEDAQPIGQAVSSVLNFGEAMDSILGTSSPGVTGNIADTHADPDAIYDGTFKLADRNQQLGDLGSEQSRLKLLDQFTQNDSKVGDPAGMSPYRCGSTTLIAAAIQGGGTDGIKAIVDQAGADLDPSAPGYEQQKKQLEQLQKSMKAGDLKMSDLHSLNGILNQQLVAAQAKKYTNPDGSPMLGDDGKPLAPLMGLSPDTLKDYIAKNPTMKGYFADGKMSIDSVDADGVTPPGAENGGDHFVLHMANGASSAIYDPFARTDHHQLVFDPEEQKNYQRHEIHSDQIDGADFGASPFMGMYD